MEEKEKSIRFIDSGYKTLFHIPDGGSIEVQCPDRTFTAKCKYIDDYHLYVNSDVFHICQFAELVELLHGTVRPLDVMPEKDSVLQRLGTEKGENTHTAKPGKEKAHGRHESR